MLDYRVEGSEIVVETPFYMATVATEGYVSGVKRNTFVDKRTGARELGFGLSIVDFLLEPGRAGSRPEEGQYDFGPDKPYHGNIPKRYVEGPQICTRARKLAYQITRGRGFLVVRQWFQYHQAYAPYAAGSQWEQILVFPENTRYFLSSDRVTSANDHPALILRIDMPGHLKHERGNTFTQVYLSYVGKIPAAEFIEDFPPDAKFLYTRNDRRLPESIIRGYQTKLEGKAGPWLFGMTLAPADVYQAWCHQRRYICMIEEIGGRPVKQGGTFGACYCVGWFDHIEEAQSVYETHRDWSGLAFRGPPDAPTEFYGLRQTELPPVAH